MKKVLLIILSLIMVFTSFGCSKNKTIKTNNPLNREQIKLNYFDYSDIELLGGEVKNKVEEVFEYFLNLDVDDMMYDLRIRRGIDTKGGKSLLTNTNSNWWCDGILMMGYWLWGYSRIYAYTQDVSVKEKANYLANSLYEAHKKSSIIGLQNTNEGTSWSYYAGEKFIQGLLENYLYCQNDTALEFVSSIIKDGNNKFIRQNVLGDNGTEWYILSESIYRYIKETEDTTAMTLAEDFEYTRFWNIFETGENVLNYKPEAGNFSSHFHLFSHLNSLSGAAMAYKIKGDDRYFKILDTAYEWFNSTQKLVTGGMGPEHEHILGKDEIIDALNSKVGDSCETQCTGYATWKLCDYMFSFTGKAKYGDWQERVMWNLLVALPAIDNGHIMYYADYETTGGRKVNRDIQWTCCCGSNIILATQVINSIYFNDTENIYVNQFVPSTVNFNGKNANITLTQTTSFPYDNSIKLKVNTNKNDKFSIKVRNPEWIDGDAAIKVNGKDKKLVIDEHGWITLTEEWKDGDNIEIYFPMKVLKSEINSELYEGGVYALSYGPIALVAKMSLFGKTPDAYLDPETVEENIEKGEGLNFAVKSTNKVSFKAYYLEELGEDYYMYIKN